MVAVSLKNPASRILLSFLQREVRTDSATHVARIGGRRKSIGLAVTGVPYAALLTVVMIFPCLVQLGPLIVLIPSIIWLYYSGDTTWGTVLLE